MASSFPFAPESPPVAAGAGVGHWEARLFGAFRLIAPDGADATPTSRKARALVAYLLGTTDDGATRERLAGLFWSERGDDQARASLRQTFYELRGLTSGDAPLIAIDRAGVALVGSGVTTDDVRFGVAARADDATALAAAVGERPAEFLADLDGVDPAFDDWLSIERTRRRDGRRRVLLAVADRRLAADDADAAQLLSDRLLASDPADEAAARIAMQASHRRGDRDAVRRHFASLTDALHRQIGVPPSDETGQAYRRWLAAPRPVAEPFAVLSSQGESPVDGPATERVGGSASIPPNGSDGAFSPPQVDPPAESADIPNSAPAASSARRPLRWTVLVAAVAILTVAAVEFVGWRNAGVAAMQRVLLVEPLQVAPGDAAAAALQSGFSDELARLVVGKAAFVVRDTGQGPDEAPDRTFVVAAEARSEGGVLHVGLRLLGRRDGSILWSTTLARPVGEVAALREQMAAKVVDVASCALDARHTDLRAFRPETLQLLFGACELRHSESPEAATLLVRLTRDLPQFSHGWAMLAAASAGEDDQAAAVANGAVSRTESYASRALQLDPHDGDAYFGRAFGLTGLARWPERIAILHEGLAVDPDNAELAYAVTAQLAQMGYVRQAIASGERAISADPFNPVIATEYAKVLALGGIPFGPEASRAFENARRRFGTDAKLMLAEFRYCALVGDYHRATQMLDDPDRGFHLHPDRAALWRALIETRADPSPAHDAAAERAFVAAMRAIPVTNLWTLETLSFLDRVDEAYHHAASLSAQSIDEDDTDSLFGDANRRLRADPRFMTLAARLGLAAVWKSTDQWPDFCSEQDLAYDCRVEATRALSTDPRPLVAPP